MARYLEVSFYTLTGVRKFIDLGDSVYGEWIVYNDETPAYHVKCFSDEPSDKIINAVISGKQLSIEQILSKINQQQRINLSIAQRPSIELKKKEELVDLSLGPIPKSWLENI